MIISGVTGPDFKFENTSSLVVVKPGQSVQDVIDSITDASEENPYLIIVPPGHEHESFKLKDWVGVVFWPFFATVDESIEKGSFNLRGLLPFRNFVLFPTGGRLLGPIWYPFTSDQSITSTDWTTLATYYIPPIFYPCGTPILFLFAKIFNDSHADGYITEVRIVLGDQKTEEEILKIQGCKNVANIKFFYNEVPLIEKWTAPHGNVTYLSLQARVTGTSTGTVYKETFFGIMYEF